MHNYIIGTNLVKKHSRVASSMQYVWLRRVGVEVINFNLANFCSITEMATCEILSRIKANAITAEEMIEKLKLEVMNYIEC